MNNHHKNTIDEKIIYTKLIKIVEIAMTILKIIVKKKL